MAVHERVYTVAIVETRDAYAHLEGSVATLHLSRCDFGSHGIIASMFIHGQATGFAFPVTSEERTEDRLTIQGPHTRWVFRVLREGK